jgi:hypothetical protein
MWVIRFSHIENRRTPETAWICNSPGATW